MKDNNTTRSISAHLREINLSDIQIERNILATVLEYPDAPAAQRVKPQIFSTAETKQLAQIWCDSQTKDFDLIFRRCGVEGSFELQEAFRATVAAGQVNTSSLNAWIDTVEALAYRRNYKEIAEAAKNDAADATKDIEALAETLRIRLEELDAQKEKRYASMTDACNTLYQRLKDIENGKVRGYKTGFSFIDERGGLQPTHLTVIAAYASNGKSAFALTLAKKLAQNGTPVGYFSLEMETSELLSRLVSQFYDYVSHTEIYTGKLEADDQKGVCETLSKIEALPLFFDDDATNTCDRICSKIRQMAHQEGVKVFVIDHLHMIMPDGRTGATEQEIISTYVKKFKAVAQSEGVCVVLLSQISRNGETEEPRISMLRGSGQIAEVANEVITIYRPEQCEGVDSYRGKFANKTIEGTAQIKIAKWRGASSGDKYLLSFDGEHCIFEETNNIPDKDY